MIENKNIIKYLELILNKKINNISSKDIDNVKNIVFSKMDDEGKQKYLIEELVYFKNIENLTISNSLITNEDIKLILSLPNLKKLNFNHCYFKYKLDCFYTNNIESLTLINCYIKDYSLISIFENLRYLEITYPYDENNIDILLFQKLSKIINLFLIGCNTINIKYIENLSNLEILNLLSTRIDDLSFVNKLNNLKKLYISNKYINGLNINNGLQVLNSTIDIVIDDENGTKKLV